MTGTGAGAPGKGTKTCQGDPGGRKKSRPRRSRKTLYRDAEKSATIERNKHAVPYRRDEIKEQALRRRETIFTAAFDQAGQQLSALRQDPKYPVIFEKLAREAVSAMSDRPFLVHVDKRDEELCRKTLAAMNIRCDVLTDLQCMGGLVVSSPDGLITDLQHDRIPPRTYQGAQETRRSMPSSPVVEMDWGYINARMRGMKSRFWITTHSMPSSSSRISTH